MVEEVVSCTVNADKEIQPSAECAFNEFEQATSTQGPKENKELGIRLASKRLIDAKH